MSKAAGGIAVTPDFTLTARADRIDRLADGSLAIIDYKTGAPPTIDEVLSLSPQLPLEGADRAARRLRGHRGGGAGASSSTIASPGAARAARMHDRSDRPARGDKPDGDAAAGAGR